MILYADTSSLVKLYVEETGSDYVRKCLQKADIVATCRIALPEMLSALTRRFNNHQIEPDTFDLLVKAVRADWRHIVALDVDEHPAADLVQRYGLRGYDAVHLACAIKLAAREQLNLIFSSFDQQLVQAASAEGLNTV